MLQTELNILYLLLREPCATVRFFLVVGFFALLMSDVKTKDFIIHQLAYLSKSAEKKYCRMFLWIDQSKHFF